MGTPKWTDDTTDLGDGRPSDKKRQEEINGLATPPPPDASGGFDVKPSHLYLTSYRVRDEQFAFDKAAKTLMDALTGKEQLAGKGEGPDLLAAAYREAATMFFDVWGNAVVGVGGAAVGFTVTANNYAAADWHSDRKRQGPPPWQQPPWVIRVPTYYGEVPDLTWRGTDADSRNAFARTLGHFPDFLADHVGGLIDQVFNLGGMYKITPGADKDELLNLASAWGTVGTNARAVAEHLGDAVFSITDRRNSEWQGAMRAFCQTLWGTAAWGKSQHGMAYKTAPTYTKDVRQPIITVLATTTEAIQQALLDLAGAAGKVTDVSEPAAEHAAKEMAKDMARKYGFHPWNILKDLNPFGAVEITSEMVMSFRSHMDEAAISAAVATYNETCTDIATTLTGLKKPLAEARRSIPTFNTEEARAEAFGGRSLNEFKHQHSWTLQTDSADVHKYPVDLVNQEGIGNAHAIDKHVAKTDEQLAQRLRDQKGISAASSYADLESAQSYTQQCLDAEAPKIKNWIDNGFDPEAEWFQVDFGQTGPVTGRGISAADYAADPKHPIVTERHGVLVKLKHVPGMKPPFVVLTSTPD